MKPFVVFALIFSTCSAFSSERIQISKAAYDLSKDLKGRTITCSLAAQNTNDDIAKHFPLKVSATPLILNQTLVKVQAAGSGQLLNIASVEASENWYILNADSNEVLFIQAKAAGCSNGTLATGNEASLSLKCCL